MKTATYTLFKSIFIFFQLSIYHFNLYGFHAVFLDGLCLDSNWRKFIHISVEEVFHPKNW